jgi:hypothetical protein
MKRMNMIRKLMGVAIAIPLAVALIGVTSASAATSTSANQTSTPRSVQRPHQPGGCNSNQFCEYNQGNGGDLCFSTAESRNWPAPCALENEGEYNRNGNAVYMHQGPNQLYCWYLLYSGHYLLYNADDYFQGGSKPGGGSCTGETLEHKLASSSFV